MKIATNVRELLVAIGIGNFNATMVIPSMQMAPATTDPRSAPIIVLVKHIQQKLNEMGAGLRVTGYLDQATAHAMRLVVGDSWESISWADNVKGVLATLERGGLPDNGVVVEGVDVSPKAGALGFLPSLPDVPGGLLTYAVGGLLAYHYWKKHKKGTRS